MERVLVGVDFDDHTHRVIEAACRLAPDAELVLVHVVAPDPDFVGFEVGPQHVRDEVADELREERRMLDELAERVREGGRRVRAVAVRGAAAPTLVERSRQLDADLIVVGAHGRGPLARMLLGSVSEGVLHRADRPVLVVPDRSS